jgi:hypothetical protein
MIDAEMIGKMIDAKMFGAKGMADLIGHDF